MATSKKPRKPYNPRKNKEEDPLKNIWDDVNEISSSVADVISNTVNTIRLSCTPAIINSSSESEKVTFQTTVTAVRNDLSSLSVRYNALVDQHRGREGGGKDPDDHAEAINVFTEYVQIMDLIETVLAPNVEEVVALSQTIIDRNINNGVDDVTEKSPDRVTD